MSLNPSLCLPATCLLIPSNQGHLQLPIISKINKADHNTLNNVGIDNINVVPKCGGYETDEEDRRARKQFEDHDFSFCDDKYIEWKRPKAKILKHWKDYDETNDYESSQSDNFSSFEEHHAIQCDEESEDDDDEGEEEDGDDHRNHAEEGRGRINNAVQSCKMNKVLMRTDCNRQRREMNRNTSESEGSSSGRTDVRSECYH